jgi:predicted nucleotidyltransferase
VRVAFVYGSIASNSEQSESDIDLMLVGTVTPPRLWLGQIGRNLTDSIDGVISENL